MHAFKTNGAVCLLLCLVFFSYACGGKNAASTVDLAKGSKEMTLNFKTRTVYQPMDRDLTSPQNYKFVEVEVAKVTNPKLHPLRFEVYYETADEKTFLGTFSLFPSDNSGTFIVPTKGKLKNEGRLILSIVLPEDTERDDDLEVIVKAPRLKES